MVKKINKEIENKNGMDKDFFKGIKFGLGFILVLSTLAIVSASGWHIANEVLSGEFSGNYNYTGIVNFTSATVYGVTDDVYVNTTGDTMTGTLVVNTGESTGITATGLYKGVSGVASATTTGANYGGYFNSSGPFSYGVYAEGGGYGVYAEGGGYGVWGVGTIFGIRAESSTYGTYSTSTGTSGRAVYGEASSATGTTYGGYFSSASNSGYGVYGSGASAGVYGISSLGQGVMGFGSIGGYFDGTIQGVFAYTTGTTGIGLYGVATSPTGVNYGVRGRSDSATGYDFYAEGAGIDYGTSSSIRWKNNITEMTNVLSKIENISAYYYTWDEEHGSYDSFGFIGEEVGAYFPKAVAWDPDAPEYVTGMDYGHMTPILLAAIKEQQEIIKNLEKRINILENK